MSRTISIERLDVIIYDALCSLDEAPDEIPPSDAVTVQGVVSDFVFNRERMESHRDEVSEMLALLPDEFMKSKGGGMSFLNACVDRNGNHWGEHVHIQELVVLGIGLGLVRFVLPRELWSALPGNMPYFVIDDAALNVAA